MKLDFNIEWGYQVLYSRRHYHPVYHWDGHLDSENVTELKVSSLEYPNTYWGPCFSPIETQLKGSLWQDSTRRKVSGIRVIAKCSPGAKFKLITLSGVFEFSAAQILNHKYLCFPVGPKYAYCAVTVRLTGYLWYRPAPVAGQKCYEAENLPLKQCNQHRMRLAVLEPGKSVELTFESNEATSPERVKECLFHLQAMVLSPGLTDGGNHVAAEIPMELSVDGKKACKFKHYFRYHDNTVQMLEDVWTRFTLHSPMQNIKLKNCHEKYPLYISRLSAEIKTTRHLQMTLPRWALTSKRLIGRIFSIESDKVRITCGKDSFEQLLVEGWNEFYFKLVQPAVKVKFTAENERFHEEAFVDEVYALADETPEIMVGYDMTVVPHDDSGFMDWLLDYTSRTQLSNTVVFRSFRPDGHDNPIIADASLARWGSFCKKHNIYVQSVNCHYSGALQKYSGEFMHNGGKHEFPGVVYACDPELGNESADMKEAYERYIAFLKEDIEKTKAYGVRPAYGDASGGHRHCYLAGASFIRSEIMVPHTQHLCSLARPAAESLGQGDWGVHIAIQHNMQNYHKTHHLGQYFLSLYQPWIMGASNIYEEDSLFQLFKEERQCWDDALTKGKRDMTRDFLRFAKTHPRKGKPKRTIAFLEGRYAAPFNGFICGPEQDPHYSVWGKFGNNSPTWGHGQPEKCRQLLDVLMPGACTHPLRQRFDMRRFMFSGTPYGDFDQVPIEAQIEYLKQYRLLLNIGWHTMISEDYEKIKKFVSDGGVLFTGIPQFSMHIKRDFLSNMNDLNLWNNGDLSELCGVIISGPGQEFSGQWNSAFREKFIEPKLSRVPSDSIVEDGDCRLARIESNGADVVAWDYDTGLPLVTCNKFGRGRVYLLCAWAYPGHESLNSIVSSFMASLCEKYRDDWFIEDPSREVFWNSWREGDGYGKIMLLNTDWSRHANVKRVTVNTPRIHFDTDIVERHVKIITVLPFAAIEHSDRVHIDVAACSDTKAKLSIHGVGNQKIIIHGRSTYIREFSFVNTTLNNFELTQDLQVNH